VERRFGKIRRYFSGSLKVLEIGSYDGAFLSLAKEWNPQLDLASLETDASTKPNRDQLSWLTQYSDFLELLEEGLHFDIVCLFHVLEHIDDPPDFLKSCSQVLKTDGKIIVEVPSLDDPLLKLYHLEEYEKFYFQSQHPYVYSAKSLYRLLEANRFRIQQCIPHQRYGLENHLTWLSEGRPGGNETLRDIFSTIDAQYRERLETAGYADAVIIVAERMKP
jgi:SAM-dependent methyltransferase